MRRLGRKLFVGAERRASDHQQHAVHHEYNVDLGDAHANEKFSPHSEAFQYAVQTDQSGRYGAVAESNRKSNISKCSDNQS